VASGWSHTALSTRKSDRDLASGLEMAGGADHLVRLPLFLAEP
jgi:hypothetical protein